MTDTSTARRRTVPPRPERRQPWRRAGAVLRWLLGAFSLVAGFTWALINFDTRSALIDSAVGLVLVGGGLVLLMPHRIRLPRLATAITMTVTAVAGALAGLAAKTTQTCCMFAEFSERGWPFHWAQRSALGDTPTEAHLLVTASTWHVDLVSLAGTLLVFAYVGMLLVVVITLIRRSRR